MAKRLLGNQKDGRQSDDIGQEDDGRLDRLFNYTKFHIGIYLSIGGGIAALFGSAEHVEGLKKVIGSPSALLIGLVCMAIAGFAGGIIASSTTQHRLFENLWDHPTGPFRAEWMTGEWWAFIEHAAFWAGLIAIVVAVMSGQPVWSWIAGVTKA